MISRCSGLSRQPPATNSAASQSSSSGCVGASPWVPKLLGERTMPRPKWCCQTRLAITRAVSGLSRRRDPVGQDRAGGRVVFAPGGGVGIAGVGGAEDRRGSPARPCRPGTCGVAAEQDERLGRRRAGLGHARGPSRPAPASRLELVELASQPRDSRANRSAPSTRGALGADQLGDVGAAGRPSAARRPRASRRVEAGAATRRPSGRGRAASGSIRAGSARRPCGSSTVAVLLLARRRGCRRSSTTVLPATVSREPSSESR